MGHTNAAGRHRYSNQVSVPTNTSFAGSPPWRIRGFNSDACPERVANAVNAASARFRTLTAINRVSGRARERPITLAVGSHAEATSATAMKGIASRRIDAESLPAVEGSPGAPPPESIQASAPETTIANDRCSHGHHGRAVPKPTPTATAAANAEMWGVGLPLLQLTRRVERLQAT
jgi:hypothetical protein